MSSLEQLVRYSLWLTAPFNLIAGVAFAFPDSVLGHLITMPAGSHPFYAYMSGALIALFGFCYAWLALQERINGPLLLVGAIGKTLAVLIAWILFLSGDLTIILAVLITGDLLFASLWYYYLLNRTEA